MSELGIIVPAFRGLLLTAAAVVWTVLLVRIVGLRAFSKMTAADFVATVAVGSLIAQAGTRSGWHEYVQCLAAIGGVFLIQWVLAQARQRWSTVQRALVNEPILLMERGQFLESALTKTRVSRANVFEKLRGAGVTTLPAVHAVVLETTGDISVILGEHVDPVLLQDVRRSNQE